MCAIVMYVENQSSYLSGFLIVCWGLLRVVIVIVAGWELLVGELLVVMSLQWGYHIIIHLYHSVPEESISQNFP